MSIEDDVMKIFGIPSSPAPAVKVDDSIPMKPLTEKEKRRVQEHVDELWHLMKSNPLTMEALGSRGPSLQNIPIRTEEGARARSLQA